MDRHVAQHHLARSAGVARTTVSLWENGRVVPRLPELRAVLDVLGVDAAERRALLRTLDGSSAARRLHRIERPIVPLFAADLLWSMRQRKGWTQMEAARAVGVQQAQIARWERGDTWPDDSKLHSLCWHLGAHADEAVALSLCRAPNVDNADLALDLPAEADRDGAQFDSERWQWKLATTLYTAPPQDDLIDLKMLAIEECLGSLIRIQPAAAPLLVSAYAAHARLHLNSRRVQLAVHWANRGASLMSSVMDNSFAEMAALKHAVWLGNFIVRGAGASMSGSHRERRQAIVNLRHWLQWLPSRYEAHRAWGLAAISRLAGEIGCWEESVAALHESFLPENSPLLDDTTRQSIGKALRLLDSGFHGAAEIALDNCRADAARSNSSYSGESLSLVERLYDLRTRRLSTRRRPQSER